MKLGLLSKDDARKLCRFFAVVGRGANLQVPLNVVSYTTGLRANQRCFDSGDTSTAEERHFIEFRPRDVVTYGHTYGILYDCGGHMHRDTIIPMVVTEVQDVIEAGQLRITDQLLDVGQIAQGGR